MWRAQTWQSPALSLHSCSTTFQQGELGHLTHVIFPFSKYRRTNASQRFEVRIKEVTLINYLAHKDAQVIMLFFCSLHLSPGTAVFFFFWKCGNKRSLGCWNQQVFKWVEKRSHPCEACCLSSPPGQEGAKHEWIWEAWEVSQMSSVWIWVFRPHVAVG